MSAISVEEEEKRWKQICSSVWRHEQPVFVLYNLKKKVSWPDADSQERFIREVYQQHRKYPFSATYARSLLKALVQDVERSGNVIEDSLMENFLETLDTNGGDTAVENFNASEGEEDVCHFSYILDATVVPLRIFRKGNLVGLRAWEAGLFLTSFCLQYIPHSFQERRVVELGAGIGCTGILLAKGLHSSSYTRGRGSYPSKKGLKSLVMTDFNDEVNDNLRHNVKAAAISQCMAESKPELDCTDNKVTVAHLDWRTVQTADDVASLGAADIVLAADCTYSEDICEHVLRTIEMILRAGSARSAETATEGEGELENESETDAVYWEQVTSVGPVALLACTKRSEETFLHLQGLLGKSELKIRDLSGWGRAAAKGSLLLAEDSENSVYLYSITL